MRFASLRQTPPFDRLRFLLSRSTPRFDRVLVVESGSRRAADKFLNTLYRDKQLRQVDVLTCYGAAPPAFDHAKGRIYLTQRATGGEARKQLFHELAGSRYSAVCLLCTGDSIMTKWKWMVACRVPAKVLIVDENAESFWLDRKHWKRIRGMIGERMGLHRPQRGALRVLIQPLLFPFTLTMLLGFALVAHAKRILRTL